jgi:hypothetical protein
MRTRRHTSLTIGAAVACLACAVALAIPATPQPPLPSTPVAVQPQSASAATQSAAPIMQVRQNLNSVLARREFQRLQKGPDPLQQMRQAILEWIVERLSRVAAYGGRNPWITRVLEAGGILVPAVLLAWWTLIRLRREKAIPTPRPEPEPWAPSAREWQRWLQEAEELARQAQWREAIHHTYWAAISRLEAGGLWSADRARTPREYLALLRRENALRPDLLRLTRSFERIWYGTAPASEQQYKEARVWTDKLVSR